MKFMNIAFVVVVISAGCGAPDTGPQENKSPAGLMDDSSTIVDGAGPEVEIPYLSGSGQCDMNESVCWTWHDKDQVIGTCAADKTCCFGCIDSRGQCQSGTSASSCGAGGGACQDCNDGLECTNDACNPSGGTCYHVNHQNDAVCGRGGHCDPSDGECCIGVFVTDPIAMTHQCTTSCPFCMCPSPIDATCLPSLGFPNPCDCP